MQRAFIESICLENKMCTRVFALFALQVSLSYGFSWDIVKAGRNQLDFFYNGALTHTEHIPSDTGISAVTYDPVHYRMLFSNYINRTKIISSFDMSTKTIQTLFTTKGEIISLAYDPVTQLLFLLAGWYRIVSFSLDPASSNERVDPKYVIETNRFCSDIAVDSCGGFIYWITHHKIERARFDGSEREVLIDYNVTDRMSLSIDQQTQKMYWIDKIQTNSGYQLSIESADLKGKNKTTFYIVKNETKAKSLTVSKDFIYWTGEGPNSLWQLPKDPQQLMDAKLFSVSNWFIYFYCQRIAANYSIEEQAQAMKRCEALKREEKKGERSDVYICQNYCIQGDCSVSAERQPKCSCKAGYSGKRCEVNACHGYCLNGGVCSLNDQHYPVCKCTADYEGERCHVTICKDYCLQGNCSVSTEGKPKCSCTAGYSGERCEVNACHDYCSNNGVCSLNEEDEPVCECTPDYGGKRCDVSTCKDYCLQGNCSVSAEGQPKCRCNDEYTGARCEINACHKHCLNNGVCSLNEEDEPFCQCTEGYDGERCDVATTHTSVNCDNMSQQIQRDLQSLKQVINEELQRTLQFYSDKIDKNETKI